MYYIKVSLTIILAVIFLGSFIYSGILTFRLIGKYSSKRETIRKMLIVSFCQIMSIFLAISLWQIGWSLGELIGFFIISILFSFFIAGVSTAHVWSWKE